MGVIILLITLFISALLVLFCLTTKSNQTKVNSWLWIGTYLIFILLILSPIIKWGFQWYLIFFVLSVKAIISLVSVLNNKKTEKPFKETLIIVKSAGMVLLLFIVTIPVVVFPQYDEPTKTGVNKVMTTSYTYIDESRIETFDDNNGFREVNVDFWYPENSMEKYPIVFFSHGAFGINFSNESTYQELASNGYIVCSIDHPYHSLFTENESGKITVVDSEFINEVIDANTTGIYCEEEAFKLTQNWNKIRSDDMNFVIDSVLNSAKSNDMNSLYHLIDIEKIGVFGHSLGGSASAKVARERNDIGAVINIDGPLTSEITIFENDVCTLYNEIFPVPLLNIYSDDVWKQLDNNAFYLANNNLKGTGNNMFDVYFQGSKHMSLTDLSLISPIIAEKLQGGKANIDSYDCIKTMNSVILDFFNCYLKDIGPFKSDAIYF
ncbi:MAG: acetylhydrolase [Clostridiales bacterium]|nr:acetylhydrolase [Clostridiales bacterium]